MSDSGFSGVPQKRVHHLACAPCHTKKAACDGERPCGRCVRADAADGCLDFERKQRGRKARGAKTQSKRKPKTKRSSSITNPRSRASSRRESLESDSADLSVSGSVSVDEQSSSTPSSPPSTSRPPSASALATLPTAVPVPPPNPVSPVSPATALSSLYITAPGAAAAGSLNVNTGDSPLSVYLRSITMPPSSPRPTADLLQSAHSVDLQLQSKLALLQAQAQTQVLVGDFAPNHPQFHPAANATLTNNHGSTSSHLYNSLSLSTSNTYTSSASTTTTISHPSSATIATSSSPNFASLLEAAMNVPAHVSNDPRSTAALSWIMSLTPLERLRFVHQQLAQQLPAPAPAPAVAQSWLPSPSAPAAAPTSSNTSSPRTPTLSSTSVRAAALADARLQLQQQQLTEQWRAEQRRIQMQAELAQLLVQAQLQGQQQQQQQQEQLRIQQQQLQLLQRQLLGQPIGSLPSPTHPSTMVTTTSAALPPLPSHVSPPSTSRQLQLHQFHDQIQSQLRRLQQQQARREGDSDERPPHHLESEEPRARRRSVSLSVVPPVDHLVDMASGGTAGSQSYMVPEADNIGMSVGAPLGRRSRSGKSSARSNGSSNSDMEMGMPSSSSSSASASPSPSASPPSSHSWSPTSAASGASQSSFDFRWDRGRRKGRLTSSSLSSIPSSNSSSTAPSPRSLTPSNLETPDFPDHESQFVSAAAEPARRRRRRHGPLDREFAWPSSSSDQFVFPSVSAASDQTASVWSTTVTLGAAAPAPTSAPVSASFAPVEWSSRALPSSARAHSHSHAHLQLPSPSSSPTSSSVTSSSNASTPPPSAAASPLVEDDGDPQALQAPQALSNGGGSDGAGGVARIPHHSRHALLLRRPVPVERIRFPPLPEGEESSPPGMEIEDADAARGGYGYQRTLDELLPLPRPGPEYLEAEVQVDHHRAVPETEPRDEDNDAIILSEQDYILSASTLTSSSPSPPGVSRTLRGSSGGESTSIATVPRSPAFPPWTHSSVPLLPLPASPLLSAPISSPAGLFSLTSPSLTPSLGGALPPWFTLGGSNNDGHAMSFPEEPYVHAHAVHAHAIHHTKRGLVNAPPPSSAVAGSSSSDRMDDTPIDASFPAFYRTPSPLFGGGFHRSHPPSSSASASVFAVGASQPAPPSNTAFASFPITGGGRHAHAHASASNAKSTPFASALTTALALASSTAPSVWASASSALRPSPMGASSSSAAPSAPSTAGLGPSVFSVFSDSAATPQTASAAAATASTRPAPASSLVLSAKRNNVSASGGWRY